MYLYQGLKNITQKITPINSSALGHLYSFPGHQPLKRVRVLVESQNQTVSRNQTC